ncbi:hydroxyacid dehydrogenase [Beutenbergia cavernae]|nr:hydroxyacid dehydrogenase [Beutenbergia cavernae]
MRAEAFDEVITAGARERIAGLVELVGPVPIAAEWPPHPRLGGVAVLITGWGSPPVDVELLDSMPNLELVVHAAGTVKDHLAIDVWERGIRVSSAATIVNSPVSKFTVAAIILAAKRALPLARQYSEHGFGTRREKIGSSVFDRTVGVVGASRIGRDVIRELTELGLEVLVYDPLLEPAEAGRLGATSVGIDDLCRRSDIVTVHAPSLPSTHRLLDARRLALLADGSIVINTARGRLIDTDALTAECATGRIDAVLDVTDPEPLPPEHPLLRMPNVLVTPHIAGANGADAELIGHFVADELERYCAGMPLVGLVDPGRLEVSA